jgi:hypothetical protein
MEAMNPVLVRLLDVLRNRLGDGSFQILETFAPDVCMVTLGVCGPPAHPPSISATVSGFGRREGRYDLDIDRIPGFTSIDPSGLPITLNDVPLDDLVTALSRWQFTVEPDSVPVSAVE